MTKYINYSLFEHPDMYDRDGDFYIKHIPMEIIDVLNKYSKTFREYKPIALVLNSISWSDIRSDFELNSNAAVDVIDIFCVCSYLNDGDVKRAADELINAGLLKKYYSIDSILKELRKYNKENIVSN